uniref:Cysteine sulfinic acid decarboxylase n=1 Tax=Nothobranchius pienaari TaxID=704102 RepID=A0A1A8LWU9_9TELE
MMEPTLRDPTDPLIDHAEGQLFLNEAFKVIVEEVLCKGTDATQKRVLDVAKFSVKTSHPRFFNQQFAGVDYHSLAGRFLTEALNTNLFTYEVAPVFVLMENEVLRSLRQLLGWTEGDGIFCPGGSMSNMYAINLARYRLFPEVKIQGLWSVPRLAIFTSPESHYSVRKGAAFLGFGTDSLILVNVDDRGHMIPEDLDEKIELSKSQGVVPLLVSCTSGTTVQGAFDPLDQIADVCGKHKLWMHADCHGAHASYLFQQDKFYDVNLDVGDKSVQCSRKVDCLKLWLMWKAIGSNGFEERVNKAFVLVRYLVDEMKNRDGFHLLNDPEFVNVCFWFIPPSLRGKEGNADYPSRLAKVAPVIKERMMKKGTLMVGYQPLGDKVNFFRVTVFSPLVSHKDLDFFLDEIERLGNNL